MLLKDHITFIVVAIVLILGLANNIYAPSFPTMRDAFQTTDQSIQFATVLYYVGYTLGVLFLGPISDAFGRKKLLITGLIFSFTTSLLCGFARTIDMFLLLRGIQGLSGGSIIGISFRAILADAFEGKDLSKAMSYTLAGYRVGPIMAPLIGGYLQMFFDWQANFFFLASYVAFVLYLVLFHLRETQLKKIPMKWKKTMGSYKSIMSNRSFLGAAICGGILYGMLLIVNLFGSFYLQDELGFRAVDFGHIALVIAIFTIVGNICNRHLLHRTSELRLIFFGTVINVFLALIQVVVAWFFPKNMWSFLIPICMILLFSGFISSNMASHAINSIPKVKGTAGALQGLITITTTLLVTATILLIPMKTLLPFACLYGALNLCVFILYKWMFLKESSEQ